MQEAGVAVGGASMKDNRNSHFGFFVDFERSPRSEGVPPSNWAPGFREDRRQPEGPSG